MKIFHFKYILYILVNQLILFISYTKILKKKCIIIVKNFNKKPLKSIFINLRGLYFLFFIHPNCEIHFVHHHHHPAYLKAYSFF